MGGSNKTTTTQSNQPATWAKAGLQYAGDTATNLAKAGQLSQPLNMSTVVPFSNQTQQAMNNTQGLADFGQDRANQNYLSVYNNVAQGGLNDLQRESASSLRNLVGSQYNPNANPGFQDVLRQSQDAATNAVNQQAAGMGRYNSGAHQGVLAQEVGDLTSRMVNDDYNRFLGRQDNAVSGLFNAGQQQMNNINTNSAALNDAFGFMQAPQQALAGVGAQYEDLYGRQLSDNLRIADESQNQQRNNLRELMALLGGSGQFGTQTATSQGPSSGFSNIMGGLLGGASLLSGL